MTDMSNYRDHLYTPTPHNINEDGILVPIIAGSLGSLALGAYHKRRMAELELEREKLGLKKKRSKFDDIPDEYFGLPKSRKRKSKNYLSKPKR